MKLTRFPLRDYCSLLAESDLLAAPLPVELDMERMVGLVSYDSKNVIEGTLFLCKGAHFKAEYLKDAAARGAFAYVSEQVYPEVELPCIQVKDMRRVIAPLSIKFYNDPASKLDVIGVTGTKGKSTTATMLHHVLNRISIKTL